MSRHSRAAAIGSTVTRAGLAAGCGGAGSLAALALAHRAGAPALAAGAVTAALAVSAAASAGTVEAVSGLLTALVRARADARATLITAKVRADLARAGLDPARTPQAAEMQRVLSVNPDLPADRRPADETLLRLHGTSRARSGGEPGPSPDTPGSSRPRNPKAASKVIPIRSDP